MQNQGMEKRAQRAETPERIEDAALYTPLCDIVESKEAFIFAADLPGVKPGDLEVSFDNGVLTIDGRVHPRQKAEQGYLLREYGMGRFYRQFTLETPINAEGIKAELKHGELRLTVPKAAAAKARKIEVKGG